METVPFPPALRLKVSTTVLNSDQTGNILKHTQVWHWRDLLHFKTGQGEALEQNSFLSLTQIFPRLQPRTITAFPTRNTDFQFNSISQKGEYYCHMKDTVVVLLFLISAYCSDQFRENTATKEWHLLHIAPFGIQHHNFSSSRTNEKEQKLFPSLPMPTRIHRPGKNLLSQKSITTLVHLLCTNIHRGRIGSVFTNSFLSPVLSFEALWT